MQNEIDAPCSRSFPPKENKILNNAHLLKVEGRRSQLMGNWEARSQQAPAQVSAVRQRRKGPHICIKVIGDGYLVEPLVNRFVSGEYRFCQGFESLDVDGLHFMKDCIIDEEKVVMLILQEHLQSHECTSEPWHPKSWAKRFGRMVLYDVEKGESFEYAQTICLSISSKVGP